MSWCNNRNIFSKGIMLFVLCILSVGASADESEIRRIMVGIKIFPAVIAADRNLSDKKDKSGNLPIYILYENNLRLANKLSKRLTSIEQIKNIPLKVKILTFEEHINNYSSNAAVFLAEPPNSYTQQIISHSIESSDLLFSPFEGDVENGVLSGFIVSDRILPYLNINTMHKSKIELKEFFIRVSSKYE